ncbi:MAG: CDP-diacylglycerol--serine O-phosphatidyltransferase [Fusobacteriaceae bacterium]
MIQKKYIAPNAITAANMLLGYLSIIASIKGNFIHAVWFIIAAMVCDTLDGKTARKLDAFSEFGKEFDSFCDAISFGLAPAILIFQILTTSNLYQFVIPISFIYALCGVMRLVKFNIMTTASCEKDDFSGMPIPCGASLVVGYYLLSDTLANNSFLKYIDIYSPEAFSFIAVLSGLLMVSTLPFQTPDKVFNFIPKKFFPLFLLIILLTLKYSLFIVTFYYVCFNLYQAFLKRGFKNQNIDECEENDNSI